MSNYNNKYYQDYLYNCNLNTINKKTKQQQNKKKIYRKKIDIPICKLNKYYIHSNNDINSNSPSVDVLINHFWPNVNIKYDNQNWIDFMNNV